MHELAVTESLLAIVVQSAEANHAQKVTDITLSIGALSSIVDDSVQFYWDHISKGTIAEEAKLHFNRIPATIRCLDCDFEFTLEEELTPCPNCDSIHLDIIAGEEFQVDYIEIQKEETNSNETTS
ncbi:MAG: hydrogenase maturation nickel metallochaperone HypA [Anaerolineaceae bacterium]|jgi:hydrogenase nickel incorporation protein HypA/HybF|nr:hydrogenase maturation nickel metallochaperone HypA [Anaerolineaceae bacterium]MDD4042206.1 hydrogenase maturation nickel metallochaperone HypA [Anaerolineaceae bacterium]MDD4577042.1 hydrogenase maturation nickel metallochaperone HypA [Anaerolineaceae bacterium]